MFNPITVLAQEPENYSELVGVVTGILALLLPVLIGLALLLFIWGLVMFLTARGSEDSVSTGKQRMFWGIIILFVMVSFWGILSFAVGDIFPGEFGIRFLPE